MPQLQKTIEQQLRLFSISGLSPFKAIRRTLYLPFRIIKKHRENLTTCVIVMPDGFDLEHNTETSIRVSQTDLAIANPNWIHAEAYFPTPSRFLIETIADLDIRFEDFTFVDLGSGKGRVLLMASQFPFRNIIGVEISPELTILARQNVVSYRGSQQCGDINPVCMDFTQFEWPESPIFVFLYNPASLYLINVVAQNLMRSLAEHPREVWILYVTPHEEVFANLTKVRQGESLTHPFCLYNSGPVIDKPAA